jgi:hypothetical protein
MESPTPGIAPALRVVHGRMPVLSESRGHSLRNAVRPPRLCFFKRARATSTPCQPGCP